MKKSRSLLSVLLGALSLSVLFSCKGSDIGNTEVYPFNNGGDERNMIVVMSDIHLGADLSYAQFNRNHGALERMLQMIRVAPNVKELVLNGDILDEWSVPATVDTYQGLDQADFVKRIAIANKGVFDAINTIVKEGNILVTYVPGNHDLTITPANVERIFPGINQARDSELGLGTYTPRDVPQLAIEHGHRYNFFCAPDPISNQDIAPGTVLPPGYFYSRIAVHHSIQEPLLPADTVPTITLNSSGGESQYSLFLYWNSWRKALNMYIISNKYDEKIIVTNVDGFTGTYSVKDILPYQIEKGGFIDVLLYKGVQDTWNQRQVLNHVSVNIPIAEAITNGGRSTESDYQATNQYFMNPNSDKRIVIFGHTHVPEISSSFTFNGQKAIYANSGTWIDHNSLAATTMTFVVVTPQNADALSQTFVKLYNFENEVVTKMAEDSLRF